MAAIDKDGHEHVARSSHSARCVALNTRGLPCGAWAKPGGNLCFIHSQTPEERRDMARRGGKARVRQVQQRKALEALRSRGPRVPRSTHEDAVKRLLEAEARLYALYEQGRIAADELPQRFRRV